MLNWNLINKLNVLTLEIKLIYREVNSSETIYECEKSNYNTYIFYETQRAQIIYSHNFVLKYIISEY